MASLRLLAPAKINLFLHINAQREDGYHQLETVFQLLDVGDDLAFDLADELVFSCNRSDLQTQDNLILKAARLLQESSGVNLGARIHLQKNMPVGGGVGGGSSDAATTLLALNHLWGCGKTLTQLADLGCQLGADIPVFVNGHSAFAEGIGEQLTPVILPKQVYLIIKPDCFVSTKEIFSSKSLTRDTPCIKIRTAFEQYKKNDCENLVRQLYPQIDSVFRLLEQHGTPQLTGTGACVFLPCLSQEHALQIQENLPDNLVSFIANGINHSSVHKSLNIL